MYKKRPLFISSSLYGSTYTKCNMEAYYSNPTNYVEGQLGFQNDFETDIIPLPTYIIGEALQFGARQKIKTMTAPTIWQYADEARNVSIKDELNFSHYYYDYMFSCGEELNYIFPDKEILAFISSPLDFGVMIFGLPKWLEMLLFEEEVFFEWLKRFIDYHNEYKKRLAATGVGFLCVSNVFLNNKIVNRKIIINKILPFLNQHLDESVPSIIHSSFMPLTATINCLEGLTSSIGYVVNESDKIVDIGKSIKEEKLLIGNIGSEYMYKRTPDTIERKTVEVLEDTSDVNQFILATTGADLDLRTSHDQIKGIYRGLNRYEEKYR